MLRKTTRAALLGSVAAFAVSGAYAQSADEVEGDVDPEACVILADRLADASDVDPEVRTEVEDVIASGDETQCHVVFDTWDQEGEVTRETLELVGDEQVTERMIVQQEIEVDADVAVYQPPAEVDVDSGTPELIWSMPRQSATVEEHAPEIMIRQGRPTVNVELPQPRVTVMIPEPEISVTWPESTLDMSELEPTFDIRIPEPTVTVNMPDPVIELAIGGEGPSDLVELEDGRFAPEGATDEDLQPRVAVQQQDVTVSRAEEAEAPEVVFNRGEPVVTFESQDPEVTVEVIGEPEIQVSTGQSDGDVDATMTDDAERDDAEGDEAAERDEAVEDDDDLSDDAEQPVTDEGGDADEGRQENLTSN